VLTPLGAARSDAWITDCLDTYRGSEGGAKRIVDTYAPFAKGTGLPPATFLPHPSENDIVREALRDHRDRLVAELEAARADIIVTLGNAALRVLRELVALAASEATGSRLRPDPEHYGKARTVRIGGRSSRWIPLAHPAAPSSFQRAHERWMSDPGRHA
jgi:uracil-DNA glycosylase